METTMISNEAYAKIVNLIKTFYMQGFEDAANCPEPVDMFDDIEIQLNIIGICKQEYDCKYCKAPRNCENMVDYCTHQCEFWHQS